MAITVIGGTCAAEMSAGGATMRIFGPLTPMTAEPACDCSATHHSDASTSELWKAAYPWATALRDRGPAGITTNDMVVIVADCDPVNGIDRFHCLDAATGQPRWSLEYRVETAANTQAVFDAQQLISQRHAFLLGPTGTLHRLHIKSGAIKWGEHQPNVEGL
jgi:outer membrane protein assembly factor BamB